MKKKLVIALICMSLLIVSLCLSVSAEVTTTKIVMTDSAEILCGDSTDISIMMLPIPTTEYAVETGDADVINVEDNGGSLTVYGLKTGTTTVTVYLISDPEINAVCEVNVICAHENTEYHEAKPSTCKTQGHGEYTICLDCLEILEGSDDLLPLGDHIGGKATCNQKAVCSECHEEYGDYDPDVHKETKVINDKPASCSETGYTGDTVCAFCETPIKEGKEIEKLPHSFKTVNAKTSTCTKDGYTGDIECEICHFVNIQGTVIPHGDHIWVVTENTESCTEPGHITTTCQNCHESHTEEVPAKHLISFNSYHAPTDDTIGYYTCDRCGRMFNFDQTIEYFDVSRKNTQTDVEDPEDPTKKDPVDDPDIDPVDDPAHDDSQETAPTEPTTPDEPKKDDPSDINPKTGDVMVVLGLASAVAAAYLLKKRT